MTAAYASDDHGGRMPGLINLKEGEQIRFVALLSFGQVMEMSCLNFRNSVYTFEPKVTTFWTKIG